MDKTPLTLRRLQFLAMMHNDDGDSGYKDGIGKIITALELLLKQIQYEQKIWGPTNPPLQNCTEHDWQSWASDEHRTDKRLGLLDRCARETHDLIRLFQAAVIDPSVLPEIDHGRTLHLLNQFFKSKANMVCGWQTAPGSIRGLFSEKSASHKELQSTIMSIFLAVYLYEGHTTLLEVFGVNEETDL